MRKKYSVYFVDSISSIETFGCILAAIGLLPLCYLQFVDLINNFTWSGLIIVIILFIVILIAIVGVQLSMTFHNDSIEKISSIDDQIEIIGYHNSNKQKLILKKSEIKDFNVKINAEVYGSFGSRYRHVYYSIAITINTLKENKCYNFYNDSKSRNIIKSIFKIAKYIPNFSYCIEEKCSPVFVEDINKIAQLGKGLNLFEFLNVMLTNSKISIASKVEAIAWAIILLLILASIVVMVVDIEQAGASWEITFKTSYALLILCFIVHQINRKKDE